MYTCGPTVYNFAHIGNFRAYICADILKRYLEYKGYDVLHVMNITDVDDKTIRDSQKEGLGLKQFTDKYSNAFFEDIEKLNIEKAHFFPKATEHIAEMIVLIKNLMKKGYAYRGEDGSIYFAISKFKDYGKLSKVKLDELQNGASERVKLDEYEKEQVQDFALWKAWDKSDGEVFWDGGEGIGKGRPGWHIECSAMSTKYLGETFDIHTGGVDLIFPHHENEIAQSEAANDKEFVKYWIHNEYLMVDGKKMSKKLGNFYTLRDLLAKGYSPRAIRYLLISAHYKVQLNFTETGLKGAEETIEKLREVILKLKDTNGKDCQNEIEKLIIECKKEFEKNMDDDLNISAALAALFDFIREVNKLLANDNISKENSSKILEFLNSIDKVIGVLNFEEEKTPQNVLELVLKREEARKKKDFALSDKLRDEIKKLGWLVSDTKEGQKVKKE